MFYFLFINASYQNKSPELNKQTNTKRSGWCKCLLLYIHLKEIHYSRVETRSLLRVALMMNHIHCKKLTQTCQVTQIQYYSNIPFCINIFLIEIITFNLKYIYIYILFFTQKPKSFLLHKWEIILLRLVKCVTFLQCINTSNNIYTIFKYVRFNKNNHVGEVKGESLASCDFFTAQYCFQKEIFHSGRSLLSPAMCGAFVLKYLYKLGIN